MLNPYILKVLIAQCAKQLFSKHSIFRSGLIDLRLEYVSGSAVKKQAINSPVNSNDTKIADQSDDEPSDSTPLLKSSNFQQRTKSTQKGVQLSDLLKKEKLYNQKFIDRVDWLDRITFAKLEEIKQEVTVTH